MIYAYARVSANDQNLQRQTEAFLKFGVLQKNIFSDKKSGKDFDRASYHRLLKKLKAQDLLVIKSIDRLGRNYDAIIEEWGRITNTLGTDILVLDMPLLDTRTKAETLVGRFISDVVLQVLSFVAENERSNIRARQAEGIALAKKRGVKFGRPKRAYTDQFILAVKNFQTKRISLKDALTTVDMKAGNFYHHMNTYLKSNH